MKFFIWFCCKTTCSLKGPQNRTTCFCILNEFSRKYCKAVVLLFKLEQLDILMQLFIDGKIRNVVWRFVIFVGENWKGQVFIIAINDEYVHGRNMAFIIPWRQGFIRIFLATGFAKMLLLFAWRQAWLWRSFGKLAWPQAFTVSWHRWEIWNVLVARLANTSLAKG